MVADTVVLVLAILFNVALCTMWDAIVEAFMEDYYLDREENEEEES